MLRNLGFTKNNIKNNIIVLIIAFYTLKRISHHLVIYF